MYTGFDRVGLVVLYISGHAYRVIPVWSWLVVYCSLPMEASVPTEEGRDFAVWALHLLDYHCREALYGVCVFSCVLTSYRSRRREK